MKYTIKKPPVLTTVDFRKVMGSIPGKTNLGTNFFKLVLVWMCCVVRRSEFLCSSTLSITNSLV